MMLIVISQNDVKLNSSILWFP